RGARTLAIIDLSPAGRQPMTDATGSLQIVLNGEIYNYLELRKELEGLGHRFQTATDTEVILESYLAWGEECLPRLNGMFAFALYDNRQKRLLLAGDRHGKKPLLYRHDKGALTFASEIKARLAAPACPRELDVTSLDYYLAYGYVPGTRCVLRGIQKLPQGHALSFDIVSGAARTWAYWSLPASAPSAAADDELLAELARLASGRGDRR